MPALKLTKSFIDRLEIPPKDVIHWDTEVRGFGVKITPSGRKVFLVQYRPAGSVGNPRKFTIGTHGEFTVEQARNKAREIANAKAQGSDPQREKRTAKKRIASDSFRDVLDRFYRDHVLKLRSGDETKRILDREFAPHWNGRSVHEITRRDVMDAVDAVAERGAGTMANRALAAIRKFFNWCRSKDIIKVSPCEGLSRHKREITRDRSLSDIELRSVMQAAKKIGFPFGSIVQALVLTGQRRDEVGRMRWSDVDLELATWVIPAEHSKNGKAHTVHLSDEMVTLIAEVPRIGDLVFSANGATAYQGWSKGKARLDKLASEKLAELAANGKCDFPAWRLHDLRRTMVTTMARLNVPHHVADKILNHQSGTISGVAAVYQRHEFGQERLAAMKEWGAHVSSLAGW